MTLILGTACLESLQALTRLVDLRIVAAAQQGLPYCITANALSGSRSLTRLVLIGGPGTFDPVALAGKTQLQHLDLRRRSFTPTGTAALAQLLSQLQQLTQLTSLHLGGANRMCAVEEGLLQLTQLLHITKLTFTEDNNTAKVLQVKVSHALHHALQCLVGLHV